MTQRTLLMDPRISANLKGLGKVSVVCEIRADCIVGMDESKLKTAVEQVIKATTLSIDNGSKSKLYVGIFAESRIGLSYMTYGVEVVLREPGSIDRNGVTIAVAHVETWRHQNESGIVALGEEISERTVRESLGAAALRQISDFLADWKSQNS